MKLFVIIFSLILIFWELMSTFAYVYLAVALFPFFLISLTTLIYCGGGAKRKLKISEKVYKIILFVIILFGLGNSSFYLFCNDKSNIKSEVAHAGGGVDNRAYLNSIEGFKKNYQQGIRIFEIDFLLTKDNQVVCSHYWKDYQKQTHTKEIPTKEEFENTLIYNKYHGITLNWLLNEMEEYSDFKVVFDSKDKQKEKIATIILSEATNYNFDIKDRIIMQVYSKNNYKFIHNLGFKEIWYTNYVSKMSYWEINNFFKNKEDVSTIVLNRYDWFIKYPYLINSKFNIAVYVCDDNLQKKYYFNHGVDYILIDN